MKISDIFDIGVMYQNFRELKTRYSSQLGRDIAQYIFLHVASEYLFAVILHALLDVTKLTTW